MNETTTSTLPSIYNQTKLSKFTLA